MIPTIWLINIWLINMWFMDGWPGWKAVPKTAEELQHIEDSIVANDVRWTPSLAKGLLVGAASGGAFYLAVISIMPWIGQIQMVK